MNLCLTSPVKYCWILLKNSITHCTGSWPGFLPGPGTPPPKNPPAMGSKFHFPICPLCGKKQTFRAFEWNSACEMPSLALDLHQKGRRRTWRSQKERYRDGNSWAWRPIPYRKSNRFKYRMHLEHNYDYIRDSKQFIYHKWHPHFNASEDPISYVCLHPAGSFCAWRCSTSSNFQVSKGWFRMSCKMVGST